MFDDPLMQGFIAEMDDYITGTHGSSSTGMKIVSMSHHYTFFRSFRVRKSGLGFSRLQRDMPQKRVLMNSGSA
jgi:hypothetical protein